MRVNAHRRRFAPTVRITSLVSILTLGVDPQFRSPDDGSQLATPPARQQIHVVPGQYSSYTKAYGSAISTNQNGPAMSRKAGPNCAAINPVIELPMVLICGALLVCANGLTLPSYRHSRWRCESEPFKFRVFTVKEPLVIGALPLHRKGMSSKITNLTPCQNQRSALRSFTCSTQRR